MTKFNSNRGLQFGNATNTVNSAIVRRSVSQLDEAGTYVAEISEVIMTKTSYGQALKVSFFTTLSDGSTAKIARLFSVNWDNNSYLTAFLTELGRMPEENQELKSESLIGITVRITVEMVKNKQGSEYLGVTDVELIEEA